MAKQNEETALPADVLASIEGAHIFVRSALEDGSQRVLVQLPGLKPWNHDAETDLRLLRAVFPELGEGQLQRARRFLASRVASHLRQTSGGAMPQRNNWVTNW